ncbi:hypothetical protein [Enterovibrio norvegicus]|uniref:hypothetical protein n=1 Tax=Enterovibrio norvegicus TaxID=188144 RepID=UPI000C83FD88|nr:hypothetical protein [Enterovibrio norvegicus]PML79480.1 hypothetical protein BCT69_14140 [Enterovibrio norvegicus]
MNALIDTRKYKATQAAKHMLNNPLKYFANERNIEQLRALLNEDKVALRLIDLISNSQSQLLRYLNFDKKDSDRFKLIDNVIVDKTDSYVDVQTTFASNLSPSYTDTKTFEALEQRLNVTLAESLNSVGIDRAALSKGNVPAQCLNTAWLVEHFALYLVGTLTLDESENGSFVFKVKNRDVFDAMLFGNALESASLVAANAVLSNLAQSGSNGMSHTNPELYFRALSLIDQHWKIDSIEVIESIYHEIADTVLILIGVLNGSNPITQSTIKEAMKRSPSNKTLLSSFENIKWHQRKIPSEDRLFETKNSGLVLGSVNMVRGLIDQAEFFAKKTMGNDWHSKLESAQKQHLFSKLEKYPHIDVLDFEIKQEHVEVEYRENLSLDVDFFIRDKLHSKIYAVQLKHITHCHKAGLSLWLEMLADPKNKLGKGVSQVDNLNKMIGKSTSLRNRLKDHDISKDELKGLTPIVLHNLGSMDMIAMHDGVFLYDIPTFIRALTERYAVEDRFHNGSYRAQHSTNGKIRSLRLNQPKEIINEYISDERFRNMSSYNLSKHITRKVVISDSIIEAIGVGL